MGNSAWWQKAALVYAVPPPPSTLLGVYQTSNASTAIIQEKYFGMQNVQAEASKSEVLPICIQSICLTCLQCDEAQPRCGQCKKHGVPCEFSANSLNSPSATTSGMVCGANHLPRKISPQSMPGKSTLQPAVAFPTYSENDSSRLMEMRLMYHCTAVTCGMA